MSDEDCYGNKAVSLMQLQDEEILQIISYLTLWDALSLEATCLRFYRLVRARQKVQTFVDISYPCLMRSQDMVTGMKNLLLTRFGPKLRAIKDSQQRDDDVVNGPTMMDSNFMVKLATVCPNLTELPSDDLNATEAYARMGSRELKKLIIKCLDNEESMKLSIASLASAPKIEDLQIRFSPELRLNWPLDAWKKRQLQIRRLELVLSLPENLEPMHVMQMVSVIEKCPNLVEFVLQLQLQATYVVSSAQMIMQQLNSVHCPSRSFCFKLLNICLDGDREFFEVIGSYVDAFETSIAQIQDYTAVFKNFTKLDALVLVFEPIATLQLPKIFDVPLSIRSLEIKLRTRLAMVNVKHILSTQGAQLLSLVLEIEDVVDGEQSFAECMDAVNENCSKLKHLKICPFWFVGCAEKLEPFLKAHGHNLITLNLEYSVISADLLHLLGKYCPSLTYLEIGLREKDFISSGDRETLKERLLSMEKLYEAKIDTTIFDDETNSYHDFACRSYHYINRKFASIEHMQL